MDTLIFGIMSLVMFVVGIIIYFVPSYIAYKRDHKNKLLILLLNVLCGWFLIGWVAALIWSFLDAVSVEQKKPVTNADELERLYELKEKGAISEDEFSRMKSKLLE